MEDKFFEVVPYVGLAIVIGLLMIFIIIPMDLIQKDVEIIPVCTVIQVSESTATEGLKFATIEINDIENDDIHSIQVPFGADVFEEGQKVNFFWLLDFAMIDKTYSENVIEYTLYDGTTWIVEK